MAVINLEEIRKPVGNTGAELGAVDLGGFSIVAHRIPRGLDYTELLRAACGDVLCRVAHYLVVTRGTLGVEYTSGTRELVHAGEVAYTPPGHTIRAIDDLEMAEISPADGNRFLMARISATGLFG